MSVYRSPLLEFWAFEKRAWIWGQPPCADMGMGLVVPNCAWDNGHQVHSQLVSLLLFPCNFEAVAPESARPEKLPGGIRKVGTKQDCCHSNEKDECCTGVQWNTRWGVDSEVGMVESLRRGKG